MSREYWFIPDETHVYLPALIMGKAPSSGIANMNMVGDDAEPVAGKVVSVEIDDCIRIEDPSILKDAPDDYIALASVNEAAILYNARKRFFDKKIYTSCGAVLMSVNPFERIPNLYGEEVMASYRNALADDLNAHVYLIPSRAYHSMCAFGKNQSLLISGESGAGKTEATKQCLSFLAAIAGTSVTQGSTPRTGNRRRKSQLVGTSSEAIDISNRIIAASPILESFGNAQTLRNPNSSRFGKWMELGFDDQGHINGSKITSYLLEKSRVTKVGKGERSYHIFYQLLRGGIDHLQDKRTVAYRYLNSHGLNEEAPDFDDSTNHALMMAAFTDMGFEGDEIQEILKCVCAVLMLGNVSFKDEHDGEASSVGAESAKAAEDAAKLISVPFYELNMALTTKSMTTGARKSVVVQRLNVDKAADTRDSLARALFDRTFTYIISRMNENNEAEKKTVTSIGLLDIFGFEIFKENSFEQLCINYCNEMLQNHFNFVIFTAEKQLYAEENIYCDTIEFRDNQAVISDIQTAFVNLDEEAKIPKGTSKTWFDKLVKACPSVGARGGAAGGGAGGKKFSKFVVPAHKNSFVVAHYAGDVSYLPAMFLEKNTERLSDSLLLLMSRSSSAVMRRLFAKQEEQESGRAQKTVKSISWNFTNQLNSLMTMLRQSDSHFIRCIKSNDACKPMMFDAELVQRQLLYSGVFEVIKIQQSGLPFRLPHQDFQRRYCCLFSVSLRWSFGSIKDFVAGMKAKLGLDLPTIQIGKTKVFYKGAEHRIFELQRESLLGENSTRLQRWLLMQTCRSAYKRYQRWADKFEAALRDVDVAAARIAFNEVISCTVRLAAMSNFDESLKHVRERVDRAMTTLQLQQDLLKKLQEVLPNRTVEGLNEVDTLLKKAESIGMPDHHLVREGLKVLKDFRNAQAAAKMVREHSSFKSLSREDLKNRIDCIDEFKDLLPDAHLLLTELRKHRDAFDREMQTVMPALNGAIGVEVVEMSESGKLVAAKTGSVGKALEVIADINESELVSADCINLIRDIRFYLKVRDQVIPSGKHRELLELLVGPEATAVTHSVLSAQLVLFKEYGYLHLTGTMLEEALQQGGSEGVPGTYTDLEGATAEEKKAKALPKDRFETVLEYISVLKSPGKELLTRREVANIMMELRHTYSSRQWSTLDETLKKADSMWKAFDGESPPKYASAKKELDNCRWQARHRACLMALAGASMETPFMDTPVSSDDWEPLLAAPASIFKIQACLKDAEPFAKPALSQPMTDLHNICDLMVQLRQAVSEGISGLRQARAVMESMLKENETGALPSEVKTIVRSELSSCEQFVSLLRYERDLERSLNGEGDFNATMTSSDTFFMGISDPFKQAAVTSHIVNLTKALEMLGNMANMLPSKLSRKVLVARELLFGKKMLLKPSFTTTQEVTAFSGTSGPATMGSFNTWSSALKRLAAFEMNENADDEHLVDEMALIREEVERRKFYSGFLGVALDVSLSGAVGRLKVRLGTMPQLFVMLSSSLIKSDLDIPVLSRLKKFVEHLLRLLELVSTAQWTQAKDEIALCDANKPDESLGVSEVSAESEAAKDELNDTLFFARNEVDFHLTLAAMRTNLEGLSVRFLNDGAIDRSSIDVTGLQGVHDILSSFRSKVPEALDLLSVAKDIISVLLPLSPSAPQQRTTVNPVTAEFVLALRDQLDCLKLPSQGIVAVTDMIMADREVDRLHELIVGAGTSREDCRALQMELQAALRQPLVPEEILAWIRATQGYCSMLLAREEGDALAQHQLALAVNEAGAALKARNEKGFALKNLLAKAASSQRTDGDMTKLLIGRGKGTLDPKRKLSTQQNTNIRPHISERQRRRLSSYAGSEGSSTLVARQQAAAAASVDLVPTGTEISDDRRTQLRLRAVQMLLHSDCNVNIRDEAIAGASLYKSLFDECVRVAQLLPFKWNDSKRTLDIVRDANQQQVGVMSRFLEVYPSAQEDIYVLQVLFCYHRVVGALEMGPSLSSTEFEPSLQEFLKIADVDLVFDDIRSSIIDATVLLKHMDVVLRVKEHCMDTLTLFREPCYDRAKWDVLANSRSFVMTKASSEPDNVISKETKAVLRCFALAHKLCIALALKLEDRFRMHKSGILEIIPALGDADRMALVEYWLEGAPPLHKEQGPRLPPSAVRVKSYDRVEWDDEMNSMWVVDSTARSGVFMTRLTQTVEHWEGELREFLYELNSREGDTSESAKLSLQKVARATAMSLRAPPAHQINDLPYNIDMPAFQELYAWTQQAFSDHDVAGPDRLQLGPSSWQDGQLLDLPDPAQLAQMLGPLVDAEQVSRVGSEIVSKVATLLEAGEVDSFSQEALLRVVTEVQAHCDKVTAWWVPLDMRHFSPFSLAWASTSVRHLATSEGDADGEADNDEMLKEKSVLGSYYQLHQRPADETTGEMDRTGYVDEVLLGSRIEAQVRRLASDSSWSYWMHPLAMLACSLNIELHRLTIWRDIETAALELSDLMHDTLAYSDTAPPLYSSADTAPTVQERCIENRHRTYLMQSLMRRAYNRAVCTEVEADEDGDEDLDEHGGTPEMPHSPLSTEYSIYLEYGSLLGAVFSLGRVGTLGALARSVGMLASVQEELLQQQKTSGGVAKGSGIINSTVPVVQRGVWAYSERVSMFASAEAVVADRGSLMPFETSLKEGDEMALSEQLARALTRAREIPMEGTDIQTEQQQTEALTRVLALVEHQDLPSGVARELLQEVVLARTASKTRSLEAVLSDVEASLPESVLSSGTSKQTNIDLDRLLLVFDPFISYLEDQSCLKHANVTRLLDLDNRAVLIGCYRACLTPTPGAAPALHHLESTLMSLGRLRRPSLRLLARLMFTVLSTRDLFVHFVAAMQVTHGEVLHMDADRHSNPSPGLQDMLDDEGDYADFAPTLSSGLDSRVLQLKGLGRLLQPLRRASAALHTLLRRMQTALWQQAEGRVDDALEEVEAMLDDLEQMRSSTGDFNTTKLPAACFDLPSILTGIAKADRDLHAKRKELVTQNFIHSVKSALKPCAIVAPLPEELDTMDTQFPFPTTYTHLGHSSSRSLATDTRALRDALALERTLWHEHDEKKVVLSAEDADVVGRAKIILQLRETLYGHPSSLEEEKNALVLRVDEIVRNWHSGAVVAPDAGLGSDEARASRALVFFDYLSRAIQEAPDRADPVAVASILHASVRHTGYEKSVGVELYLEQANAILDLMLAEGGQRPWALPLVPPPDNETTVGADSMVTRRLTFSLHSRQLSEGITRRRSKLQQQARASVLLMEMMRHYCPLIYGPSLRLKARSASPYVGGPGFPGAWDGSGGPLQAKPAPFQLTDRSFMQMLANLKSVLGGVDIPTRYVDGKGKDQYEEGEWGALYDWDGDLSEEELERRAGSAVLPYAQAQFAALVNSWGSIDSFSDLSHAPGLMYPLAVLRSRLAMYRRRAIAEWDRARSMRHTKHTTFPSPTSFFELSFPVPGEGNITEDSTGAEGNAETKKTGPGRLLTEAMSANKYKKLLDQVVGTVDTLCPPMDRYETDQELDGYTPCSVDELSAHLDPHTRELRALQGTASSVRGAMLPPIGSTEALEWRHAREALKVLHQSHASNHLDEAMYVPAKLDMEGGEENEEGEGREGAMKTGAAPANMWAARPQQAAALLALFQEIDNLPPLLECESRLFIDEQVARTYIDLYTCYQTLQGLSPEGDDSLSCCPQNLRNTVEIMLRLRLSILKDDAPTLQVLADQFYGVVDNDEHAEGRFMKWASLQNWFELSTAINMHNKVIDCMLYELNPSESNVERKRRERKVGRILAEQTCAPVDISNTADDAEEDNGAEEVFFTFVNVNNLRTLIVDSDECALQSHQLHDLTEVSKFVLAVMTAIDHGLWLEHEEAMAVGRGKCIQNLLVELEGLPTPPRAVAHELQMLAKVCENKQFEHKLLLALRSNHEYLEDSLTRHAEVDVTTLRECLEATSRLRHRGKRNMALFSCATLVLELRTAVKFADWEEIRRVLKHFDPKMIVPHDLVEITGEETLHIGHEVKRMRDAASEDSLREIDTMQALADENALMHKEAESAFKKSKVCGISFMRLDCHKLSVQELIRVSHSFAKTPRISSEDKTLWYSLEKLTTLRSSLITNDHLALVDKMKAVKVARVHQGCVEEVVYIKKAVEFSQIIGRVRKHLETTSLSGHAGTRFVEDINILHLEKMLLILNPDVCPPSSKAFLLGAMTVLKLRHAIKANHWDIVEATKCVLSHHNVETAGNMATSTHEPRKVRHIEILKEIFGHTQRSHDGKPLSDEPTVANSSMEAVNGHVRRNSSVLFTATKEDGSAGGGRDDGAGENLRPSDTRRRSQAAAGDNGGFDVGKSDVIATYRDRPGNMIHVSSVFAGAEHGLDPQGVPALLYALTQSGILKEAEAEVTLVRDELYHRVACSTLRAALSVEVAVEPDQETEGKGFMPASVALDNAIASCRHLGIRSEESHRLFQTALFMRAVRQAYSKGDIEKTMTMLGLIEGLKRNNRFDVVATAEVEGIFRNICSATIIGELSEVLEEGLLGRSTVENEMKLKKSLRKANTVDALTDEAIKVLSICDVIVALQAALRSCVIGRIELNLSRSERIASSIQVVSSTTSTAFARLEEVQGAARQFIGDQQSREAQREIDLVTNAPTVLERTEEASDGLAESKDPTPAMKLSLAPLPDGERETAETREKANKLQSSWLTPRQSETDSSQLPVACHTLAGALARAINGTGADGKIVVHRGGVFQDLLEGVLSIKQANLWSRASTPIEVGSVSSALMLCTLLLAPLTYHPVTLMSRDADTPAKKMILIKRRKEQSTSEIVFDVKLLSLARGVIEAVAQQQEERNLEIEVKQAKAFIAAEEQQERLRLQVLMQQHEAKHGGDYDYGTDGEDVDEGEGDDERKVGERGAMGTINDLVEEEEAVIRIHKGPVGASVVNSAFLQLGEFLSLFMESHLTDKQIRTYAVTKLNELKETRRAKNLIGLDYITGVLEAGSIEGKPESSALSGFSVHQAVKDKFSYI